VQEVRVSSQKRERCKNEENQLFRRTNQGVTEGDKNITFVGVVSFSSPLLVKKRSASVVDHLLARVKEQTELNRHDIQS
jgi:hypothetical protein